MLLIKCPEQMQLIRQGLEDGFDVSWYAKSEFDNWKMFQIFLGLDNGLDVSIYAKPEYSWEQMREIRERLEKELDN